MHSDEGRGLGALSRERRGRVFPASDLRLHLSYHRPPPFSAKQFYSITGQTKLLIGLPGRISDALAAKNCTRAALLLLLGTHVHQGLRLDTTAPDATQVLPFFPGDT